MATGKGTEVAEKQTTEIANMGEYEGYAGQGFENQDSSDYALPFLHILQGLSKKVQEDPKSFHQGMIINTVTGELFEDDAGIEFIPATTKHQFVEWKPLSAGGGFVAAYEVTDPLVREVIATQTGEQTGALKMPNGNELIETYYVYGIHVQPDGSPIHAVIAFSSSKIKKYKQWMTKARTIQLALPDGRRIAAPLFSHKYRLKTVTEKNSKGSFANWDVVQFSGADALSSRLSPKDQLFLDAVACRDAVETGKAKADHDSVATTAGTGEEGADNSGGSADRPEGKAKF